MTNEEWLTVYVTDNTADAHIVAGRLQHEGIPSWVNEPIGRSALMLTVGSLGEVTVLVRPEDYERALAVLAEDVTPELEDSTGDVVLRWSDGTPDAANGQDDHESQNDDEYDDEYPE
jgi:hypothetical protein